MNSQMKKHNFFYRNGLSIVFVSLFLLALVAQAITGWKEHNNELAELNQNTIGLAEYLHSGHFIF